MDEVRKALEMGYGLVDEFEFWEYKVTCYDKDTNSGGLFEEYINTFLKLEQESSGYPSWFQIEEDKKRYIEDYWLAKGIVMHKAPTSKNAGQSSLGKLKLNIMWGKWAQIQNKTQKTLATPVNDLYELLTISSTEATNFIFPNDDVVWVFWK